MKFVIVKNLQISQPSNNNISQIYRNRWKRIERKSVLGWRRKAEVITVVNIEIIRAVATLPAYGFVK